MQVPRIIFLSMLLFFTVQGQSQSPILESKPILETKGSYFLFASSKMRQIYDHGGWDIQLSSSIPVWKPMEPFNLNVYGSIEFLRCSGHSTEEHSKTYVWQLPINIGIKPIFLLSKKIQYYVALGPRYFFIHQHNFSQYVDKSRSRNGLGLFVNTGFNFILYQRMVIDLCMEYSYAKTHLHSSIPNVYTRTLQVGGLSFGGGLGYSF